MTLREELLQIHSYKEFDEKREKFRELPMDYELLDHIWNNIFPKIEPKEGDALKHIGTYKE